LHIVLLTKTMAKSCLSHFSSWARGFITPILELETEVRFRWILHH